MSRRPKLPSLPAPPADATPQQRSFFQAIKQHIDALVGQLGEKDRAVTFRDLEDGGLAQLRADGYTILPGQEGPEGPAGPPGDPGADGLGLPTVGAGVIPPAVANLKAVAAYSSIILTWDDPDWPAGASTFNVAYFEIFRATSATPNPPVPDASYSFGQTRALVFSDLVGTSKTYYYWVRIVGKNNEIGPVVGPVSATTSPNVPQLLDLLTGQITESQLYSALTDRIDLIDAPATGLASQYTFKVDVAGHIAGYGFATTAADAAPYSAFGLRADQFWVAPPAVASATAPTTNRYKGMVWVDTSVVPSVVRYWDGVSSWVTTPQALPFVVQTTPTTVNGVAVAPGVYIDDLFVKNGSITNAKIGNAAIDDAKIANLSADKITAGTIAADRLDAATVTAKVANLNAAVITQGYISVARILDGTITNAKIGTAEITGAKIALATITDANIASLNADKITAGTIGAGRIAAGSITADKIDSRNLSIKDAAGNILFSASNNLNVARIAGLGSFATLSQINAANISSYMAAAAIGTAYIGDAQVTTLKIGPNQVTLPVVSTGGPLTIVSPYQTACYITTTTIGASVIVLGQVQLSRPASETTPAIVQMRLNNTFGGVYAEFETEAPMGDSVLGLTGKNAPAILGGGSSVNGSATYNLDIRLAYGSNVSVVSSTLVLIEAKR